MKKIEVLSVENSQLLTNDLWLSYLSQIPKNQQKKVEKFRFQKDKQMSLLGKLLLKNVLEICFTNTSLNDIKYTKYQKPYFEEDFSFNISHSGDYVVLAYSLCDSLLGIDIEKINKNLLIEDFNSILTFEEREYIKNSKYPYQTFYDTWTIKEAVSKADGRGLGLPFKDIKINQDYVSIDQNKWFSKSVEIASNYRCHVVSNHIFTVNHNQVELQDLNKSISPVFS